VQPQVILAFSDKLSGVEFHPIKQLNVAAVKAS
jgi:hypothetical protein